MNELFAATTTLDNCPVVYMSRMANQFTVAFKFFLTVLTDVFITIEWIQSHYLSRFSYKKFLKIMLKDSLIDLTTHTNKTVTKQAQGKVATSFLKSLKPYVHSIEQYLASGAAFSNSLPQFLHNCCSMIHARRFTL